MEKSCLQAIESLLVKYREVARAEMVFREEISKLRFRDVLPTADANSLRLIGMVKNNEKKLYHIIYKGKVG